MAEEAVRTGAWLVHYSTDYVFDGTGTRGYVESDPVAPQSVYGRTKALGEAAVRAVCAQHLIFRVAWVYGVRGRNFLLTVRRLAGGGGPLRIVDDQVGVPTWSRAIAEATAQVMAQRPGDALRCGISLHVQMGEPASPERWPAAADPRAVVWARWGSPCPSPLCRHDSQR